MPSPFVKRPPLWLLVLVTTSGTLGIHIFVPALPQAAQELGVGNGTAQLAISLYILGLALGQLVYGPLSDQWGRRPVLLGGLGLYTLAGLVAALAPDAISLIAARLFQALGGCAGLALGRAIVRDTAETREAASRLAALSMVVSVGPGIAPLIGTALSEWVGWRSIFALLAGLGAVTMALVLWRLPETRARGHGRGAAALISDYAGLLRSPRFLGFAIGGGCATTSWYAFLAALPFILVQQLGRPVHEVGFCYILLVGGTAFGNLMANRMVARFGFRPLILGASATGVLGALFYLAVVLGGWMSLTTVLIGPLLFTLGIGLASPLALTQAVSVNPQVIGSASGLYGCSQMAVGALCASLAGVGDDPALASAVVLFGAAMIGFCAFALALRRPR
ncbi:multidrug effflux MFS transporter [Teichococcus oryzae]|uniref:Bcr/CflA family efflux transporter n=1 Tax=Teichococcus oryzae TaxID=1608942 RepID=A0A5B2TJL0_9PROT|nr:multidrug effflux MFS transporter [Pseudoroseomonas oryzae]KAA2214283.1 multidrug effflux MFS transporter [Pseudoroseomonas oryzae]